MLPDLDVLAAAPSIPLGQAGGQLAARIKGNGDGKGLNGNGQEVGSRV